MDVLDYARRSLNEWRTPVTTLLHPGEPVRAEGNAPHAVVIGAGFGGLAAAVRLLVRGYHVTVLERLDQAGGRARVFRDAGFTFDAGPTIVTAPFLFEELWALAGERMDDHVQLVPTTPFYRIRFGDGQCFDYTGDPDAMRKEIARFNVRDVQGWERLLEHAEKIFDVGFTALAHAPFGKATDMARVAPDMVRLENYRTVYALVSKYIEDERLRQVFSFHPLLIGGNPMAASSIYTLIAHLERKWGVHFAMGGTGALVTGLASLIERLGGEVRLGAEVEEIIVEQGRARGVRLKGRERIEADVVISNADSAWTYRHLIRPEHRKHWTDRRIDRARYSMGLFVWYFGTKRQYPDVAHHTIMLGPRYAALLNDIFENKVLADDFSLYLHRPTATDPSLAPAGCDGFYVLSPVPHLQSGTDWKRERENYRVRLERFLESTVLPELGASLVTSRVLDPQGFLDDYLSMYGAAFGLEPVLTQSAYFRPHNESEDVRGLYLVGAGTHPGAGLPGVLSTARVLDTVVPDPSKLGGALALMSLDPQDVAHCRALLAAGSKSFDAASRALPQRLRDPVAVLYAFCRVSDDAVDESGDASAALQVLTLRLDRIYRDMPGEDPVDRALAAVVALHGLPRAPLDALLEGYAWDAEERTYVTLSELHGYCARVAASVGVAMTYLMGERDPSVLARAIDLGVAMQLTNIARDVGEDARRGRIYLPLQWIETREPRALRLDRSVRDATRRLLDDAEVLYARALLGVPHLPADCRLAICSAAYFYRAIGRRVRAAGDDGVTRRQSTCALEKAALLAQALIDARTMKAAPLRDPVLPEAAFLLVRSG